MECFCYLFKIIFDIFIFKFVYAFFIKPYLELINYSDNEEFSYDARTYF